MYLLCSLSSALFSLFVSQVFLQWSSCAHDCKMKGGGGECYTRGTTIFQQLQLRTRGGHRSDHPLPPHSLFPSLSLSTLHFSSLSFEVVLTHTLTLYWRDRRSGDLKRGSQRSHERRAGGGPMQNTWGCSKCRLAPYIFIFYFSVDLFLLPWCNRMWSTWVWRTSELMWYMYCI